MTVHTRSETIATAWSWKRQSRYDELIAQVVAEHLAKNLRADGNLAMFYIHCEAMERLTKECEALSDDPSHERTAP